MRRLFGGGSVAFGPRFKELRALVFFFGAQLSAGRRGSERAEKESHDNPYLKARHRSAGYQTRLRVQPRTVPAAIGPAVFFKDQAGWTAGWPWFSLIERSCSRRTMALSLPPMRRNRQVKYIQVKRTMMEARAR